MAQATTHYVKADNLNITFSNHSHRVSQVALMRIDVDNHGNETFTYYVVDEGELRTAQEICDIYDYTVYGISCANTACFKI